MGRIRKFTIGIAPQVRMYRIHSLGGQIVDAVLALRLKNLPEDFFEEVLAQTDRQGYRLRGQGGRNILTINDLNIAFTRDYHDAEDSFDFEKCMDQFKTIWTAVNTVLHLTDVRRIGMVSESKYEIPKKIAPSVWMRNTFSPQFTSELHAEKFNLRFEERKLAKTGLAPDPKKEDFINVITQIYDGDLDAEHPSSGFMFSSTDVQRYFAPVISGKTVGDEMLKLKKQFDSAFNKLDDRLKNLGAIHAK